GGSCQVSSTLYNAVLQLTGLTVLRRAPHGANGIAYLPHGVDASSGGLNFVFRNDYPFPVRIYAHVQDGSLFVAFYKESV
ncbi:MAG: VanW family protein, partial [Eubacteriales bacterium]|nr:VanW family protein [Eubacteriales bacterium]